MRHFRLGVLAFFLLGAISCGGSGGPDADGDGVVDDQDVCPGYDDRADGDGDGVPDGCDLCRDHDDSVDGDGDGVADGCDPCPTDNPNDSDGDGVCDSDDLCAGFDDEADFDGDGVADGCDPCPADHPDDADDDGVCDGVDVCLGSDDTLDGDGDGVPDGCDPCPADNPDDADEDGVCDGVDACPGSDDTLDGDGDGVPDGCDPCPADNPDDADDDGVCDGVDACLGSDDTLDGDGDGVPDGCDPCPADNPDDTDGDEVCDSDDVCPGFDDGLDGDGDGQPDDCDPCPADNPDDSDGDAVCNSDDLCPGFADGDDLDADLIPDGCDPDLDGDGLPNDVEVGCPSSSEPTMADSDGDGFDDLVEVAVGSDPCNPSEDPYDYVEFLMVLAGDGEVVSEGDSALEFASEFQQQDVHFNMDTTGSMGEEIAELRDSIMGIIDVVQQTVPNSAFGLSSYRDFPISPFGYSEDYPYRLEQTLTTTAAEIYGALSVLGYGGGNDGPESGWEALYQLATGAGGVAWPGGSIAPGGQAGFRAGSFRMVFTITDNRSHTATEYAALGIDAHSRAEAVAALNAISAPVVGVSSGTTPKGELRALALDTGAVVPVCAFDGNRPAGCSATQCCTGLDGQGEAPVQGECPLVFTVYSYGSGLGGSAQDAIGMLSTHTSMRVTAEVVGQQTDLQNPSQTVNSACFITAVTAESFVSSNTCGPSPQILGDAFEDVLPGAQLYFRLAARNDGCALPAAEPLLFEATVNIWGDQTYLLDSMVITIVIPPAP